MSGKVLKTGIVLACLGLSAPLTAFTDPFAEVKWGVKRFEKSLKKSVGLSLRGDSIEILSEELGLHPYVRPEVKSQSTDSTVYAFHVGGVPLCRLAVSVVKGVKGSFVFGTIPDVNIRFDDGPWSELTTVDETVKWLVSDRTALESIQRSPILNANACWFVNGDSLKKAYKIHYENFLVYADESEIFYQENLLFHQTTTGEATVYERNPIDGRVAIFEFPVAGDGTLTNNFFQTMPTGKDRASNADNKFNFASNTLEFAEASVFSHANSMLAWFFDKGFEWNASENIDIKLHVVFSGNNKNNALYQPADSTTSGKPTISIGDGDGLLLQGLALDSDVVSHELGHHVVYRTLTSVQGESLVLHEGLADYFAFAESGDSCLAESICPADSPACWVRGQCLRTANNTLTYQSSEFSALQAHLRGQLISGFLIDLKDDPQTDEGEMIDVVMAAVSYLLPFSGYRDFLLSLFLADERLHGYKNACAIQRVAEARGFSSLIEDVNCLDPLTIGDLGGQLTTASGTVTAEPTARSKSSSGGCVVGLSSSRNSSKEGPTLPLGWILLFFPVPLFLLKKFRNSY